MFVSICSEPSRQFRHHGNHVFYGTIALASFFDCKTMNYGRHPSWLQLQQVQQAVIHQCCLMMQEAPWQKGSWSSIKQIVWSFIWREQLCHSLISKPWNLNEKLNSIINLSVFIYTLFIQRRKFVFADIWACYWYEIIKVKNSKYTFITLNE